jgi:hypothetical protein
MLREALEAMFRRSMDEPVFERVLVVHPSWIPAILRAPGEAGLRTGDRLFSLSRVGAAPVPVLWESHDRPARQDGSS